jgi:mono/diheme cytochrome c family protein
MVNSIATAAIITWFAIGAAGFALRAQAMPSVWDGVYTEEQAKRGAVLFDRECAGCHGPSGAGGGMAPALTDSAFSANYDGQTVGDLFDRNRNTMPPGKEGQLSGPQNADITAFILQCNKFPAGTSELPTQSMTLKQIKYVADRPEPRLDDRHR